MRTKNVLRNVAFSLGSFSLVFLLGLATRKAFVAFFSVEYLGYEGLFSNIFSLMSLAEMGVSGVISYSLYKEIAENNVEEINKLMMIFKLLYQIIGCGVAVVGGILFLFLPVVIRENITNWTYVRTIFLVQLLGVLVTYFLSYRRILFQADQKQYLCVKTDTVISLISNCIRLLAIVVFKNYLLYLWVAVLSSAAADCLIMRKSKQVYPYTANKVKITREDIQKRHLFREMKDFFVHKLSYLLYRGVDNIVISMVLGIKVVAYYSNYMLIFSNINRIISMVTTPIQASVGNLIYAENVEDGKKLYHTCNLLFFFMAAFTATCFLVLFQPFIVIWLGENYLLPLSFAAALALNHFIEASNDAAYHFRSAFGEFRADRGFMVMAAVANLILSVVLASLCGITGIVIGTVVGMVIIVWGRTKFVFTHYFKLPYLGQLWHQCLLTVLFMGEAALTYALAASLPVSIWGLAQRLGLCLLVPNSINLLLFCRTKAFANIMGYVTQSIAILLDVLHGKKKPTTKE